MHITLSSTEKDQLATLVSVIKKEFTSFQDINFLIKLHQWNKDLPRTLLKKLNEFKYQPEGVKYLVVEGLDIDDQQLGPTPPDWTHQSTQSGIEQSIVACLYSSVLGDLFAWSTQQDGKIIHDVMPIKKDEHEQLGTGSLQEIEWHIEDAFHEYRGDYCTFFCLRNHDMIPTTIGSPDFSQLSDDEIDELFKPQFSIKPDESHKEKNESQLRQRQRLAENDIQLSHAYKRITSWDENPPKISVLFGNRKDPFIRIDPYFMLEPETPAAQAAFKKLIVLIDEKIEELALRPGEILLMDNYRVVHGRRKFLPKYDGTDRWFKRINVTRDIRRSAELRATLSSHTIL
ncbi:arginine beta-hydroxylase, Fe(II)/alpha-ketoglutarate-dependent [Pseudoalteromonas rubra]|uniref:Arginine beta-hydroxylase, Fe(II)/alpha-ketoglutarate-dependent n=1 Tax=Pseudoalteromonas rubra TaxID=43658 RepID=A0A4Q7ELX1_9GAMM|nr:guanitoxin biosynthesis L-enduracididine beta-hydroxylase GntD [Pseudoalteromonas rubra]RZM84292.1 arginine beta-hydroxylase, Fe(II)/alpha-ketoglutarate-dependent [Pseudoalteromonas rubra]